MDKNILLERVQRDRKRIALVRRSISRKEIHKPIETYKKDTQLVTKETSKEEIEQSIEKDKKKMDLVKKAISEVIVGQQGAIDTLLRAIIANGHVLIEGVPGIAKTLMVRAIAEVTQCKFGRIQFTPDLLPLELVGLTAYSETRGFYTIKGPIFNNFVLADEINRAPPKTQSALLEAMQERQATIGNQTFYMLNPFFIFATQNPIETLGTNPLPEAQLDRFLFKMKVGYPTTKDEQKILKRNISIEDFRSYDLDKVLTPSEIIDLQNNAKKIYMDNKLEEYIVSLVDATRNPRKYNLSLGKYIQYGCSPRASISLFISSKAEAVMKGMSFVTPLHIRRVAPDVMRHRILVNYEGKSEDITSDDLISEILKKVPIP